jgi:GT2 family glycosyltransferase
MTNASVSIVIPNFNGEPIIDGTLAAVRAAVRAYPGRCEVVVVDDASTDRSVDVVSERHPEAVLVRHEVNAGFAEAVHSGVAHASHDVLILLNSDVKPASGFIEPLVAPLADENVFATSPLVLDATGSPEFVSWTRYVLARGKLRPDPWTLDDVRRYQDEGRPLNGLYASGGSMAVRRDRFLELGGFMAIYKPFYSEDTDLGTRAWMRGWATRFVPESRVVHASGGTISRLFRARQVRATRIRNQLIYLALYTAPRDFFLTHLPRILLRTLTRLARLDATMLVGLLRALGLAREIQTTRAKVRASQPFRTLDRVLQDVAACR